MKVRIVPPEELTPDTLRATDYIKEHSQAVRDTAKGAIERGDQICYDVAATYGQIFENVKHMDWFHKAVAEWLEENEPQEE